MKVTITILLIISVLYALHTTENALDKCKQAGYSEETCFYIINH